MSYEPTSSANFTKQPQYVEETTEGTLPLASPTFKIPGIVSDWSPTSKVDEQVIPMLGARDYYTSIMLGLTETFQIKYSPLNSDLMKYGVNLPGGAGTNDKSISWLATKLVNNVEKFKVYKGCRTSSISIDVSRKSGVEVTQNFQALSVTPYGSTPVFVTPTFAPDPTTDPWSGITSGLNPLTIQGTPVDTPKFSCTVDQGLAQADINGEITYKFLRPGHRKITLSFDTLQKDAVLLGDLTAYTTLALVYNLTPTVSLTFAGVKLNSYSVSDSAGSNDFTVESYAGTAKTVTLN